MRRRVAQKVKENLSWTEHYLFMVHEAWAAWSGAQKGILHSNIFLKSPGTFIYFCGALLCIPLPLEWFLSQAAVCVCVLVLGKKCLIFYPITRRAAVNHIKALCARRLTADRGLNWNEGRAPYFLAWPACRWPNEWNMSRRVWHLMTQSAATKTGSNSSTN